MGVNGSSGWCGGSCLLAGVFGSGEIGCGMGVNGSSGWCGGDERCGDECCGDEVSGASGVQRGTDSSPGSTHSSTFRSQ